MKRKRFVFDEELWNSGLQFGCTCEKGILKPIRTESAGKGEKAIYLSTSLDSQEKETIWSRLQANFSLEGENSVRISYFASDEKYVEVNGERIHLDNWIEDISLPLEQKLYMLDQIWIQEQKNKKDMLLYEGKGRYLWFKIEFLTFDSPVPEIKKLQIEFPLESILEYLPAFYREDKTNFKFLSRFLGIFQSLIYDLQYEIDSVSKHFDVDFAEGDFLLWLSQWVAVEYPLMWDKEKRKIFIKNSFRFYQKKGTKECLEDVLELYLGQKPKIMETYEILEFYEGRTYDEEIKRLYSDDIYSFFVFIEEKRVPTMEKLHHVKQLISFFQPAHTKAILVVLRPSIILGQYSYLGVNSMLSHNSKMEIKDNSALPFDCTIWN